jgi:4-amino-4-deoxy-L-arabinose transferase-like glycosyltransferase
MALRRVECSDITAGLRYISNMLQVSAQYQPTTVEGSTPSRLPKNWLIVTVIVLWIGCFHGLNAAGIFDRDEGLYSTASRQMLESGDWVVPRIGPDVRFAKPPLIYWLQVPGIALFGATPFAVRLPSALAAALTALLLMWWARRHGAERAGWLAAIVLPLCPLVMGLSRQGITDSVLMLCLTLTMVGWIEGYRTDRRWYYLMAAGAALATLAKGVIGTLLPGAAFIFWLLLRRDGKELRRVPFAGALCLYLLIAVPWHIGMYRATGDLFIQEYFLHNHVQRFTGEAWGHVQPFWYYVLILLVGMFPWSVLLPSSWWRGLQSFRAEKTDVGAGWAMWAVWAVVVVGFFSISRSKLPGYIMPAVPALSLLVGVQLDRLWRERQSFGKMEMALLGLVSVLLGAFGVVAGILGQRWSAQVAAQQIISFRGKEVPERVLEPVILLSPLMLGLGALFLSGSLIVVARRRQIPQALGMMVAMNVILALLLVHAALPVYDRLVIAPLHDMGRRTLPALARGEPLVIYGLAPRRTSLRFVVGHTRQVTETEKPDVLRRVLNAAPRGFILTERETQLPSLPRTPRREASSGHWVLWRYE